MRERGVDTDALWRRIIDMVLKTLISGEHHVLSLARQHVVSHYCCHELFGFDVLLDEKLRPWLLEVSRAQLGACICTSQIVNRPVPITDEVKVSPSQRICLPVEVRDVLVSDWDL